MTQQKKTPCQQGDPEDWFIDRRGLRDDDEALVTFEEAEYETRAAERPESEVADVFEEMHAERAKARLATRRHAKDACFTECSVRTQCLATALEIRPSHGTWGGYYEEELGKLYRALDARRSAVGA